MILVGQWNTLKANEDTGIQLTSSKILSKNTWNALDSKHFLSLVHGET